MARAAAVAQLCVLATLALASAPVPLADASLALATARAITTTRASTRALPAPLPVNGFVGVDIVDILWSYAGYTSGNATYARATMRAACAPPRGLSYVRFAAAPYWAAQLNETYLRNESVYWSLMDSIVADAIDAGCALMPSLFFNTFAFPDAFGEPAGVVFDAALGPSRARAAMEAFAAAFATRYRDSPAVAALEVGNECVSPRTSAARTEPPSHYSRSRSGRKATGSFGAIQSSPHFPNRARQVQPLVQP